jgi:outer membrane protein assembly factor BamD
MPVFGPSAPRRHALRRFLLPALPGVLALALAACGTTEEEPDIIPEQPVEQLYNDAMDELYADNYKKAAELFDEVERQHPYSVWATKGTLMSAFAYYRNADYAEAVVALDHFIGLHPAHENIDYAYYLRALCYYERITDVSRDQTMTERARESFEELINRFPDSKYALDAKPKLVLVRDQLAGKEMLIGRFYQQRGHYLAAINRFRDVVTNYDKTSHVPEALLRLTELYVALGVMDQAQEYAAVLGYNFPGSDWYVDSYDLVMENRDKGTAVATAAPAPAPATAPAPTAAAPAPAAAQPPQAAPPAQQQGAYPNYYTDYYSNQTYAAPTNPPAANVPDPYAAYYQALQYQSQTGYYAPAAQPAPQPAAPPAAPAPTSSAPQYPPSGAGAARGDAWGGAPQTNSGTAGPSNPGY